MDLLGLVLSIRDLTRKPEIDQKNPSGANQYPGNGLRKRSSPNFASNFKRI